MTDGAEVATPSECVDANLLIRDLINANTAIRLDV